MSNIGPNFRPPWQQSKSGLSKQPDNAQNTQQTQPQNAANLGQTPAQSALSAANVSGPLAMGLQPELALASQQLLLLLKNLLQMPKELAQLMALLGDVAPDSAQALLQSLLESDVPVSLEDLQKLLLSHADTAQEKLLKLLQSTAMSSHGQPSQLGELLGTMTELLQKAKESPTQALQSTMNLYLPYYPLHPPQAFSLRFEANGESEADQENAAEPETLHLTLFINTLTLGQLKISLSSQNTTPIEAIIHHEAVAAPFEKELIQQTDLAMGGPGRMILLFMLNPTPKASQPKPTDNPEGSPEFSEHTTSSQGQSVAIHPTGGISMSALYGAYTLIRVIFEIDTQNKLHLTRSML